jgi:hypothetical protein
VVKLKKIIADMQFKIFLEGFISRSLIWMLFDPFYTGKEARARGQIRF